MKKLIAVFFIFSAFVSSAQLKSYSYYRELKPVNEKAYYEMSVNSLILDRPGSYRVYELGKDTMEVPYITGSSFYDAYDKTYFRNLRIIDKSYESGKFSYATLILDTNIIYNSLYLNFAASEFFKDVTLEGSDNNKKWKTIIENEKLFHYYREPGDHYYRNKIVFEPISYKYLRLKIDDANGERLDLASASVPLYKEEVVDDGESVPFEIKRIEDKEHKQTIIECTFQRNYQITNVKLKIENENAFRRNVNIEFLAPNQPKENWIEFGDGTIASNYNNKFYLNHYNTGDAGFKSNKMRVLIHNLDDRPLDKIDLEVFTHHETIKLKLDKDKKYVLAYGKTNDASPQYDLEHFKNSIPLNLKKAELDSEEQIEHAAIVKPEPLMKNKMWIWGALVVCVAVIGVFAVKLLKPNDNSQSNDK
jgi:hypothetical protein